MLRSFNLIVKQTFAYNFNRSEKVFIADNRKHPETIARHDYMNHENAILFRLMS